MKKVIPAIAIVFIGCTHQPQTASDYKNSRNIASEAEDYYRSESPQESLAAYQALRELIQTKNSEKLKAYFTGFTAAQKLVTSYKIRIKQILNSSKDTELEMAKLRRSRLACKLIETKANYLSLEEKFTVLLGLIQTAPDSLAAQKWIYNEMKKYSKFNFAAQSAMANLLLGFKQKETSLCGSVGCLKSQIGTVTEKLLSFDWENVNQHLKFMNTYRSKIADYTKASNSDLLPGDCFGPDDSREPNQVADYDWKKRNWTGTSLNPNEFIVTYDDGPHKTYTQQIADAWKAAPEFEKPTFFWLSKLVAVNKSLAQSIFEQGFPIGSHSGRHPDIGNLAKATKVSELSSVNKTSFANELVGVTDSNFNQFREKMLDGQILTSTKVINDSLREKYPDFSVNWFRLPFGSGTKNLDIGKRFAALNVEHMFWAVDSLDWQDKNPMSIRDNVLDQMKAVKRGIILFHDIHPQSLQATKLLIEKFRENGTKIVSLGKLAPRPNYQGN